MVKGVNKTVIEINHTGNRYFEKIVFYVTPEYGNLSAKQLKKAASEFSYNYEEIRQEKSLRSIARAKKRALIFAVSAIGFIALMVILALIL